MIDVEVTPVRIQSAIDTPFRVVSLFVFAVLIVIIVINGS